MANYQIKSGDCLWNIVKANYNCTSNKEISEMVNTIAKENNIKNSNVIKAGANLVLPHNDKAKFEDDKKAVGNSTEKNNDSFQTEADKKNNDINIDKLAEFEKWASSEENMNKALNNEKVEDFKMFDLNLSTYSKDMKQFSQDWINKYDADKDGNWNYNEFVSMATNGETNATDLLFGKILNNIFGAFGIKNESTQLKADMYDMYKQQFDTFSFDNNKDSINAGEVASVLYTADLDIENFNKTNGDVASSIDGKLNYINYQTQPTLDPSSVEYDNLQYQRQEFYNAYYAE